jgi:hypothetical protein
MYALIRRDWYPTAKDGEDNETAKLRLKQIRQALKELEKDEGAHLELVDMGTQTGTTFPIHARMYEAIASADIILRVQRENFRTKTSGCGGRDDHC